MAAVLYVDRKGAVLGYSGGAVELRVPGEELRTIPGRLIDRVVLRADTLLGSASLAALAHDGIGVVAFGGRSGDRVAHVLGAPHGDVRARVVQTRRCLDEATASQLAARMVRAKLVSQMRVLRLALSERPDLRKPLLDAANRIGAAVRDLRGRPDTPSRPTLRGIEGAAASAYFSGYAELFAPSLGFTGRRRRPAPDPVNAALSLGYTLLHAEAVRACWSAGLDPMIGFLHAPAYGRASLACDLMEPWRARVDAWVWQQFRKRALREDHFGRDGAGTCLLSKAGRGHFYEGIGGLMRICQKGLLRQARTLATRFSSSDEFVAQDDDIPEVSPC